MKLNDYYNYMLNILYLRKIKKKSFTNPLLFPFKLTPTQFENYKNIESGIFF